MGLVLESAFHNVSACFRGKPEALLHLTTACTKGTARRLKMKLKTEAFHLLMNAMTIPGPTQIYYYKMLEDYQRTQNFLLKHTT